MLFIETVIFPMVAVGAIFGGTLYLITRKPPARPPMGSAFGDSRRDAKNNGVSDVTLMAGAAMLTGEDEGGSE